MLRGYGLVIFSLFIILISSNFVMAVDKDDKVNTEIAEETGVLQMAKDLLYKGRTGFYNNEQDFDNVLKILELNRGNFLLLKDNFNRYYYSGRVDFLSAEIYEVMGDQRRAAEFFNRSAENAERAVDVNGRSSDVYRLLADSYMRLMTYNGKMYMMSKGPEALKLLKRSLSLNKENYKALNSLATYYINAPEIGGGNIDRGIKVLEEALNSKDDFDNFISYIWLGQAYLKKGRKDSAKIYIEEALDIYSDSLWAGQVLSQIEGSK